MLQIHHAETDASHPSKSYADACWTADPALSPDWWRESLGYTVGKMALDWRTHLHSQSLLTSGCNLVLVSPATIQAAQAQVAATTHPDAFMLILCTASLEDLPSPLPPFIVWHPGVTTPESRQQGLVILESLAQRNHIEAYGVSLQGVSALPLHQWLDEAAQAAHTVWSRRKRPALRLIHGNMDLLDLSLLTTLSTQHKGTPVSALELAARLSLAVVVTSNAQPGMESPPEAALAALTHLAVQEHTLNQKLGGWPVRSGQPLFSVLAALSAGGSPWPTVQVWESWLGHLWPSLRDYWQTAGFAEASTETDAYLQAFTALLPHGPALSAAAAAAVATKVLEELRPRFPAVWQAETPATLAAALISSIPAVTALACEAGPDIAQLAHRPNMPDVGAILLEKAA